MSLIVVVESSVFVIVCYLCVNSSVIGISRLNCGLIVVSLSSVLVSYGCLCVYSRLSLSNVVRRNEVWLCVMVISIGGNVVNSMVSGCLRLNCLSYCCIVRRQVLLFVVSYSVSVGKYLKKLSGQQNVSSGGGQKKVVQLFGIVKQVCCVVMCVVILQGLLLLWSMCLVVQKFRKLVFSRKLL